MKQLILILSSIVVIGCSSNNTDNSIVFSPTPVNYSIKFRGEQGGFNYFPNSPDTQTMKITSSTEYNNYVTSLLTHPIAPSFNENYSFQPVPDFSTKDILAINYKCISDLGQRLLINSVIENSDNVTLEYHWEQTTAVQPAAGKPFILVEVPKSSKPAIFKNVGN